MRESTPVYVALGAILAAAAGLDGQGGSMLTFEAASVKRTNASTPDGRMIVGGLPPMGGPGTDDPGRIRYPAISLHSLIVTAYDLKTRQNIVGPDWLEDEFFQIEATLPAGTTLQQLHEMLRNLLAERFQLKAHSERKESPAWAIVVAKGGPKMKESTEPEDVPVPEDAWPKGPPPANPKLTPDGFNTRPSTPKVGSGMFSILGTQGIRLTARRQTVERLAKALSAVSQRPVVDRSGLTARYDFIFTFYREGAKMPDGEPLPDIFSAIQSQLGLKLESSTAVVERLVIDHVERTPTGN